MELARTSRTLRAVLMVAALCGAGRAPAEPAPGRDAQVLALVDGRGRNRGELERRAGELLREAAPRVRYARGYPRVESRRQLAFREDLGDGDYVVLGVCPADRGEAIAGAIGAQAVALARGEVACPTVLEPALEQAFEGAVARGQLGFAEELARTPASGEVRARLAAIAAADCEIGLVRSTLAGGPVDVAPAMEKALVCSGRPPADAAADAQRSGELVAALLAAGAEARAHADWIAAAIGAGRLPVAKQLAAAGVDPRAAAGAILRTAAAGPAEALEWALSLGVAPDAGPGVAPLMIAAIHGRPRNVALLLRAGADPAARTPAGRLTPLDLLLLVPSYAGTRTAAALVDARPAFRAAYQGDVQALAALPHAELDERWGGWTPLAVAAARGRDEAGLFLLERGADPTLRVGNPAGLGGHDVLSLAIDGGARRLALALVAKGVPLDTAAGACCLDRAREDDVARLVDPAAALRLSADELADAPPERWSRKEGRHGKRPPPQARLRPIHRAALLGQEEVVRALLARGVDPDARDDSGQGLTAAMLAAQRGQAALFGALAEARADAAVADAGRCSALAHAMLSDDPGAVTRAYLSAFGKRAAEGSPGALASAVRHAGPVVVEQLVALGAGRRGEGKRASRAACDAADQEMFELLEQHGVRSGRRFLGDCVESGD